MRTLLLAILFMGLTGCSGYIVYHPEDYNSCSCFEFDSLVVDADFDNSYIYPLLNLSCELPESQLSELKDLTIALKRTEQGVVIPCDSVSMKIFNDSGKVMLLNTNKWPTKLPDSMHTASRTITVSIEKHYLSITDNPERWFIQLKAATATSSRDSVYAFKAEKAASTMRFH